MHVIYLFLLVLAVAGPKRFAPSLPPSSEVRNAAIHGKPHSAADGVLVFFLYVGVREIMNGMNGSCYSNLIRVPAPSDWNPGTREHSYRGARAIVEAYFDEFLRKCSAQYRLADSAPPSYFWNDQGDPDLTKKFQFYRTSGAALMTLETRSTPKEEAPGRDASASMPSTSTPSSTGAERTSAGVADRQRISSSPGIGGLVVEDLRPERRAREEALNREEMLSRQRDASARVSNMMAAAEWKARYRKVMDSLSAVAALKGRRQ